MNINQKLNNMFPNVKPSTTSTYDPCASCNGLTECVFAPVGYVEHNGEYVRCKHNTRGGYNNPDITKPKYAEWYAENKDDIIRHINRKKSIFLHGPYGRGKTHGLYYIANQYNLKGVRIYLDKASEVARKLKQEIAHTRATGEVLVSEITKMKQVDMLFLDDMGNEQISDFIADAWADVIDYRYRNQMPMFISSNYSIRELAVIYADTLKNDVKAGQIVSRIKTLGPIEIKSKNWREDE